MRKDAQRDIRYRRCFIVAPNKIIADAETKFVLYCPRHDRQFSASWKALRYAGTSCSKQTCADCDLEHGAISRGRGTRGGWFCSEMQRKDMRVVGVWKDGETIPFREEQEYVANDYLVLECSKVCQGQPCGQRTIQKVTNLRWWLSRDPNHLRCQGSTCQSERKRPERERQIRGSLSPDWSCVALSPEKWSLRHICGYELCLTWEQLKKFSETAVDQERCAVCSGRIPHGLGRTEANVRLWLEVHVPHVQLHGLKPSKRFEVILSCREHGGRWAIGATALRLHRSAGCKYCVKQNRAEKRSYWRNSIEVVCSHVGVWPQHSWPNEPDERCDWVGVQKHRRASIKEILKEFPVDVHRAADQMGLPEAFRDAPFLPSLSHYAIAGWLQADGYDTTRVAPRAAITLLACDLPILTFIASNVRCLSRLSVRFRPRGKPPGVYLTLTITDEEFLSWIAEQFGFSRTKGEDGYPRISMNHSQATAYLSGLLGGDGHISLRKGRSPRIQWLVAKNKSLATWVHFEVESMVLTEVAESAEIEDFMSTGNRVYTRRWDTPSRKLFTLAVLRKKACARVAGLLLEKCRAHLPARKAHSLQEIIRSHPALPDSEPTAPVRL